MTDHGGSHATLGPATGLALSSPTATSGLLKVTLEVARHLFATWDRFYKAQADIDHPSQRVAARYGQLVVALENVEEELAAYEEAAR